MRRVHLVNANNVDLIAGNNIHAVFPAFLRNPEYREFFRMKGDGGSEIIFLNTLDKERFRPIIKKTIKTVFIDFRVSNVFLFKPYMGVDDNLRVTVSRILDSGLKATIVLRPIDANDEYRIVSEELPNVGIAFPDIIKDTNAPNAPFRVRLINSLVRNHDFDFKREHYLYGLSNPAELCFYNKLFMLKVSNTFKAVVSSRCFVDSFYGIKYYTDIGLSESLPGTEKILIEKCFKHSQQFSLFTINDELMRDFEAGRIGSSFYNSWIAWVGGSV